MGTWSIILAAVAAIWSGALVLRLAYARGCRRRIRQWAERNGYAVLRIEYRRVMWPLVLPFIVPFMNAWYVRVQDEQGGRRGAYIHFGTFLFDFPGGKMQVEWQ